MVGAESSLWLGAAGFALGAILAVFALVGRATKLAFCRRCGHSVPPNSDCLGRTCTECGATFSHPSDLRTRRRYPLIASIGLVLATSGAFSAFGNRALNWFEHALLSEYKVESTYTAQWGSVRISSPRWPEDEFRGLVEVFADGQLVYRSKLIHPSSGEARLVDPVPPTPGEESPQHLDYLWITESTAGSGGYSTTFVFQQPTNGELRPVCTLENGVFTKDFWIQADMTYRYWLTSGAGSPSPCLTGVPTSAGMHWLDPDGRASLPKAEFESMKESIRNAEPSVHSADQFFAPALRGFLNLVYAGRAPEAWVFLDECFDAGLARFIESGFAADIPRSRESFRRLLVEKIGTSPFHAEVLRRNHGSISPPER